jgi:hypothetical protein
MKYKYRLKKKTQRICVFLELMALTIRTLSRWFMEAKSLLFIKEDRGLDH